MATQSILGAHTLVSFVATRHPAQAKAFYRDTLGLRFVHEDQFAIVFDAHGTTLRVTIVMRDAERVAVRIFEPPDLRTAGRRPNAQFILGPCPGTAAA